MWTRGWCGQTVEDANRYHMHRRPLPRRAHAGLGARHDHKVRATRVGAGGAHGCGDVGHPLVVGQRDEVIAVPAIPRRHLRRRQGTVGIGGVGVQISAIPAARQLERIVGDTDSVLVADSRHVAVLSGGRPAGRGNLACDSHYWLL